MIHLVDNDLAVAQVAQDIKEGIQGYHFMPAICGEFVKTSGPYWATAGWFKEQELTDPPICEDCLNHPDLALFLLGDV